MVSGLRGGRALPRLAAVPRYLGIRSGQAPRAGGCEGGCLVWREQALLEAELGVSVQTWNVFS